MSTEGVKYIGSKAALIPYILKCIDDNIPSGSISSAIDVFTGTTRVAQAFKQRGWRVQTSDLSWASQCYAGTWIENGDNRHLAEKVETLNNLPAKAGWLTQNYCDVKGNKGGIVRVWQAKNGARADAIRDKIEEWSASGAINAWEKNTLVTSLILALDKVDNTVGVQQAYLKDWCKRSHNDMKLQLPVVISQPVGKHHSGNCLQITYEKADLAYLDPPYSSHSYATYYHIWDSIAAWDKPAVGLNTNRRADRVSGDSSYDSDMASAWNSKKSALAAFESVIDRLPVRWILISYNNESLVDIASIEKLLKKYPRVITTTIDYKRNIMSQIGNATKDKPEDTKFRTENVEYLFLIDKRPI